MMIPPSYRSHSVPLDLNHEPLVSPNHIQPPPSYSSSSSFSPLSFPILFNNPPDQQAGSSYYSEPSKQLLPSDHHEKGEKNIPCSGSWDDSAAECSSTGIKVTAAWKKEEEDDDDQRRHHNLEEEEEEEGADHEDGNSTKKWMWMPSKMRIIRSMQMMVSSDQTASMHKLSPPHTNNINNNYSTNSNITVRVCSDCHTTKTPLWRSGPKGPKSLCNACGIRQRKARRAMAAAAAAAASANGTTLQVTAETSATENKEKKKKKSKTELKKKRKRNNKKSHHEGRRRNKFGFEDLRLSLSKNLAVQQVFPQDEKDAAILLMALSYGLVNG